MPANDLRAWASAWHPDPRWENTVPFDPADRPVLHASVEHRAWIAAIEDFLNGHREKAPELDFGQCGFGAWLRGAALVDGQLVQGRGGQMGFRLIDELHQRIHVLAAEILVLREEGLKGEAFTGLAELHALRNDLFEKLDNLLQPA